MSGSPHGDEPAPGTIAPIPPIDPPKPIAPIDAPPPVQASKPVKDPRAKEFFLPKVDPLAAEYFVMGPADASLVEPLIDGVAAFLAMEKAILEAESSLLIGFWDLDPDLPLLPDPAAKTPDPKRPKTWLEALIAAAARGVQVRVLLSDFDPLFSGSHATAWYAYFRMVSTTDAIKDRFQVMCARQETEIPDGILKLADTFAKGALPKYDTLAAQWNAMKAGDREARYLNSPGVWDKFDLTPTLREAKLRKPGEYYPVRPGSHHQKLLIVDGKRAFAGGMNVRASYEDNPSHTRVPWPWHDSFVKVEGKDVLAGFIKSYMLLWNRERKGFQDFIIAAYAARKDYPKLVYRGVDEMKPADVPAKAASSATPGIPGQIHRTLSDKGDPTTGYPVPIRKDIEEGYLKAIGQAERFLYFENQYFRVKAIFEAIVKRKKERKDLIVILLVPGVIEELAKLKPGERLDPINQHGMVLQYESFKLLEGLKGDAGIFRMVRPDGKDVYVHSKLLIVDDVFASLGSANSNPRSYYMDTELDFVWYDPATVRKLREDLWNEHLGKPAGMGSWKPSEFLKKWTDIAKQNAKVTGTARKGFVLPFTNIAPKEGDLTSVNLTPFT
jgi:phosphatidylserine/phosphatidylglycerophosphate/cardiolipin synthase-like enzyme